MHARFPLILSALALSGSAAMAQTTAASAAASASAPAKVDVVESMVMLVPVEVSVETQKTGCWAQFYDRHDFKGDTLTLVGPVDLQSTSKGNGRQIKRDIDSLVVGPKATLQVFEHEMFKDRNVSFGPGTRQDGLVRKLGFGGRIESLRLQCSR